jgi:long-chain acyl-CoA synthetase
VVPSFGARLDAVARAAPRHPALIHAGHRLSWRELDRRAGGVAKALVADGLRPGHRIALAMPNGADFAAALLGAFKLGLTVAPLNPQLTHEERDRIIDDFHPKAVLHSAPHAEADLEAVPQAEAPALVLYTSGSTGRPKGAVLSHRALAAGNAAWRGPVMALTSDDRVLAVLPLSHSYGINGALLAPLLSGATVVLMERFTPGGVVAAVREHAVTVFPGVATMFQRMLDTPGWGREDVHSLRIALSGAAPCPWSLTQAWRARTGVRILRGYGMTELFRPISYLAHDPRDFPDAIGRPVPGVEIRVVDDDGHDVTGRDVGELLIRTDAAMDGYLGHPEETAASFSDGWFKTGDLATVSSEGFVSIVGRKKELILRGGYSVAPAEVEAALCAHAAVAEAAVIGLMHPELGEEVAAFVTLRTGAWISSHELADWCKERLAGYKCPRVITIVSELPKGPTGKVLKARLRDAAVSGRPACCDPPARP